MEQSSWRWTTVSDSPHDHEREALAFLRRRLPDRDPYRVWANFEFVAPSGALYEVDALVVTDNGVYLIEIKSHPGTALVAVSAILGYLNQRNPQHTSPTSAATQPGPRI